MQKGFIQIPILIAVIVGVFIVGGTGYVGMKKYQNYKIEQEQIVREKETKTFEQFETQQKMLEQAQKEIEKLKNKTNIVTNSLPQSNINTSDKTIPISMADIVSQYAPSISIVECTFTDGVIQYGSGTIVQWTNNNSAIFTNKHVLLETRTNGEEYGPDYCKVYFLDTPTVYTFNNDSFETSSIRTLSEHDMGWIAIKNPDIYIKENTISLDQFCTKNPDIGASILVLGYPSIGASQSITATDGIIAGYDGDYYVTSAKVNRGNSGGIAIDVEKNCYLGIPTYSETDIESLARILKHEAWW